MYRPAKYWYRSVLEITSFTGHRNITNDKRTLRSFALTVLKENDVKHAAVGMALGWDMAVGMSCFKEGIPYTAHVPFKGQEKRWPIEEQRDYNMLLSCAQHVVTYYDDYQPAAFFVRNEEMIKTSTKLIAMYNGSNGGTEHAIGFALRTKLPYINVWPKWQEYVKWTKMMNSKKG